MDKIPFETAQVYITNSTRTQTEKKYIDPAKSLMIETIIFILDCITFTQ